MPFPIGGYFQTSRISKLTMTELTPNVEHGIQMYEIAKYIHIKHTTHISD